MFNELNSLLDMSPEKLPGGNIFLMYDDSMTDGQFLIQHFLHIYLKSGSRVCFLSLMDTFSLHSCNAAKRGLNLTFASQQGRLHFIDSISEISKDINSDSDNLFHFAVGDAKQDYKDSLKKLYQKIKFHVDEMLKVDTENAVLVAVDSLCVLLDIGLPMQEVLKFFQYCTSLASRPESLGKVSFVTLFHRSTDKLQQFVDDDNNMMWLLCKSMSDVLVGVESLPTGRSKDVHGQLIVTHRNTEDMSTECQKRMHFKVLDKSVSIFPIGSAIL